MTDKNLKMRKQELVFLNILFCLLVIFIHISSEVVTDMPPSKAMQQLVSVFSALAKCAVPGFLVLSGVKMFLKNDFSYKAFYRSRFCKIIIPYVIWVSIYYAYTCIFYGEGFSFVTWGRHILLGDGAAHFYFIVILIQFYLLMPVWQFLFRRGNPTVILLICLVITILSGDMLNEILNHFMPGKAFPYLRLLFTRYLVYFAAGCVIGQHYDAFCNFLKRKGLAFLGLFFVAAILCGGLTLLTQDKTPLWMEEVRMFYYFAAILFFFWIAQLFAGRGGVLMKPFVFLDKATYDIYLVHCLLIMIINQYMTQNGIFDLTQRYAYRAVFVYGVSILGCSLWQVGKYFVLRKKYS